MTRIALYARYSSSGTPPRSLKFSHFTRKRTFSTLSAGSGSQLIYGEPRWSFAHKAEMPLSRKNAFRDTIARFAVCFLD
jgi:hypothetical protein